MKSLLNYLAIGGSLRELKNYINGSKKKEEKKFKRKINFTQQM